MEKRAKHFKRLIEKRIASQHVEDVWQEALVRLLQRLQTGHVIDNLDAYMATVCSNTTTDMLRHLGRRAQSLTGEAVEAELDRTGFVVNFDHNPEFERIQKILRAELTAYQHKVYILKHHYGLDSRSIADLVGAAGPGAVRQALRAANRRLRVPAVLEQLSSTED
ncbi:RNA polymerase sigma factor [[Kitasatospora] papulosa]|uniref:RNA polymerase sigma factor n=1 Tax=[Kitasatospora] papulosa TaxID=1464011 RepID=UPI0036252271